MFTKYPFSSRFFLFILLPFILISFSLYNFLLLSVATTDGVIRLGDINKESTISYDTLGIAHINATTDLDAFYSLGFAHAQNRLWQMEMNRRTASGTLSEILGRSLLGSDIYMRTLGLHRNAKNMWLNLEENEKSILSHYVAGVNQGIQNLKVLPIEYQTLDFTPSKWTEIDSLLWMQLMTVQLSGNSANELQRSILLQAFGVEKTNTLMTEVDFPDLVALANSSLIPEKYRQPNLYVGSNAWAVSGSHTTSGKAMLANDPHLANSLPSIFYLAQLTGDKLNIKGATFPGLPFVVIGQNKNISWGLTNMMADTQDIFLEKINPSNRNQYEVDGEYKEMEVYIEEITIKKVPFQRQPTPYKLEIRRTEHGPILSDTNGAHTNYAYSLRWTGDDQNGGTFKSFLALNYAKNWAEFTTALRDFIAPIHNFVYADKNGHIGVLSAGAFPIRSNRDGAIPAEGWSSEDNWQGWIPSEEWPKEYDPESGLIVSANNKNLPKNYPYHISSDWAPDYRSKRISALLKEELKNKRLSIVDFKDIQLDVYNSSINIVLPYLMSVKVDTVKQQQALKLLQGWDGEMSLNSIQTSLYTVWLAHFNRLLLEDDGGRVTHASEGESALLSLANEENQLFIERVLSENKETWCDYRTTEIIETCSELLLIALEHGLNELEKTLGNDINGWQWSKLHAANFPHFPFSDHDRAPQMPNSPDSILEPLFHRKVPNSGGGQTVNVAPVSLSAENRFSQFHGPSYRQIIDWGKPEKALFSLSTGQSGNIMSKHYDDLLIPHQQGKYFMITPINKNDKLLRLTPQKNIITRD